MHPLLSALPNFIFTSSWMYLQLVFLIAIFTLPLVRFIKVEKSNLSIIFPVLGFAHLLIVLAVFASFVSSRVVSISLLFPIVLLYGLLTSLVAIAQVKQGVRVGVQYLAKYRKVFLVHFLLFLVLSVSSYDVLTKEYFVPGYTNNHDSINILSSVIVLRDHVVENNITATIGNFILTKYPQGGTYLSLFVSQLAILSPYDAYHRSIVFLYLLLLFPAYALLFQKTTSRARFTTMAQWGVVITTVVNYLGIAILNTAVLGSTLSSVLTFTWIVLLLFLYHYTMTRRNFILMSTLIIVAQMFLYVYFSLPLLLGAALAFLFLEKDQKRRWVPLLSIGLAIVISMILIPSIRQQTITMATANLSSPNKEANLMGGAVGNTAGFISPMEGISLWIGRLDYRYPVPRTITIILFAAFCLLQLTSFLRNRSEKTRWPDLLIICCAYLPLILVTYGITKSPYQNVKAYQYAAAAVPLIFFWINPSESKKILPKVTLAVYIAFVLGSAMFSYIHIQRPPQDTYVDHMVPEPCAHVFTSKDILDWNDYLNIKCEQ